MKIGDIIGEKGESLSFEFFPPKDEGAEAQLFDTGLPLMIGPPFKLELRNEQYRSLRPRDYQTVRLIVKRWNAK